LTRFMIGLDEAFRSRPDTAAQDTGSEALPLSAVDQVFQQWLRELHPQEILDSVIDALLKTVRRATLSDTGLPPAQPSDDPGWLPSGEFSENPSEPREAKDESPEEMGLSEPSCSAPPLSESAQENTGAWAGPWATAFLLAGVLGLREAATRLSPQPARTRHWPHGRRE